MDVRRDEEVQDAVFDVAGVITHYVYDREDILREFDGTNTLLARYTHGPGVDEPLVMERDLNANGIFEAAERFAYHTDGLGSVTELTDSTGAVVRAYVYDAYGRIVTQTGALENPYTFTGREFDAESGLYFYRARYYDARTGRFTQEDPVAGLLAIPQTLNRYPYVANNPLNLTDPSGELFPPLCVAFGAGVSLGAEILSVALDDRKCLSFASAGRAALSGAISGGLGCGLSSLFGGKILGIPTLSLGRQIGLDFGTGAVAGAAGDIAASGITGSANDPERTLRAAAGGGAGSVAGSFAKRTLLRTLTRSAALGSAISLGVAAVVSLIP